MKAEDGIRAALKDIENTLDIEVHTTDDHYTNCKALANCLERVEKVLLAALPTRLH